MEMVLVEKVNIDFNMEVSKCWQINLVNYEEVCPVISAVVYIFPIFSL